MVDTIQLETNLLKALAHPARLRILQVLAHGEACVCHLTTVLQKRQPYVSQHLMILREAGLVTDRRDGLMVYYRLAHKETQEILDTLRQVVEATHPEASPTPVPEIPVPGCPCPICQAAEDRDAHAQAGA